MPRRRYATHIPPVADGEQRQHANARVFGCVECARHLAGVEAGRFDNRRWDHIPERTSAQGLWRKVERFVRQDSTAANFTALIARDLADDLDRTHAHLGTVATEGKDGVGLDDRDVDLCAGLCVVLAVGGFDGCHPVVEVELGDSVGLALMQVDSALMGGRARTGGIDGADDRTITAHDLHLVGTSRAQPDATRWATPAGIDPKWVSGAAGLEQQLVVDHKVAHAVVERLAPIRVVGVGKRFLECSAREVRAEDERVIGVDDRPLGSAVEQFGGVAHDPLVELVVAGN